MSEIPVHPRPRRLVDWINPTGVKKVHSLIDKVYQRKNLEMAWEMVKANRGSGGVDGQSRDGFAAQLDQQWDRLQSELKEDVYRPQPVRQVQIPKAGKPGEFRTLGIPTIYDRVCQQALLTRLEPIFEPVFDEASFGYRRGRSTKDAMRKVWKEIQSGQEWIVDADLKDFFDSIDRSALMELVKERISDRRVLKLIRQWLEAGVMEDGTVRETYRARLLPMSPEANSRVAVNPAVRSGQPIICGTRTTVADILSLLASGASQSEILGDFPWISIEDVEAALEYAAEEMRGKIAR